MTWHDTAACRSGTRHPDTWHSNDPDEQAEARAVCQACPVLNTCETTALALEAGLPAEYRHGIYAGLDPNERAAMDPTAPAKPTPLREYTPCGTPSAQRRHQRRNETCTLCRTQAKAQPEQVAA